LELSLLTHLRLLDLSNSPFLVGTLPSPSLLYHVQALYLQQTAMTGLLWMDESFTSLDASSGREDPTTTTTTTTTTSTTAMATTTTLIDLRISAQQGLLDGSTLNLLRNLNWLEWKKWSSRSQFFLHGPILPPVLPFRPKLAI
jgi:hypothetical protein